MAIFFAHIHTHTHTHTPLLSSHTSRTPIKVVSEKYDEVVFTNPKASFHQSLVNGHVKNNKKLPYQLSNEPCVMEHFRTYGDETEVKTMLAAKKFLEDELRNVKDRLLRVDAELEEMKHALAATRDLEEGMGLLVPAGGGSNGVGSGGASSSTTATIIPTSSGIGNNKKTGTLSSANTIAVAGSKGNSGRAEGGKTMKKKAPPPSASAALEYQQPTGKKLKSNG